MRVGLPAAAAVFVVLMASVGAQSPAPANFSGDWLLDPARTTTTGGPARVGGPGRATAGGSITAPVKIRDVAPRYPPEAQRDRIGGLVILEATIDAQGNVADLEVLRGEPVLQPPALEAVSQWKYRPATLNGAPVPVVMMVTVTFAIGTTRMTVPPLGLDPQMLGRGGGGGGMGGGVGIGPVPVTLSIIQDKDRARITRPSQNKSETLTYRLDGKPSKSRVRSMGGAVGDAEVTFESRWDGPKLVTTMTWRSAAGPQLRTEAMSVEGEILTVQITRPALPAGGEPTVRTAYYMRKAK